MRRDYEAAHGRIIEMLDSERFLTLLDDIDALLAEPPDGPAAEAIGAALVALELDRPEALGATVAVLGDRLLAELGLDGVTFAGPLHGLLGALAAGYARALVEAATG